MISFRWQVSKRPALCERVLVSQTWAILGLFVHFPIYDVQLVGLRTGYLGSYDG
jgi:hypothetical protein